MHVLAVHNEYKIRGGEDECYEAEVALLRERGHKVEVYEETNDRLAHFGRVQLAAKTVWSQDAYQAVRRTLAAASFDVMHVQNFFPLISPSIYYAAKAEGVPIVQTLHNYRLLCPNALFFRGGQVCEDCLGKVIPYPGVQHGCYRENKVASAGVATLLTVHRFMRTWTKTVDLYVALTEFARQKFIEGGLPAEKIVVKPHFIHPDPGLGQGSGGYALYVGRLSVEKGLDTLLDAWTLLGDRIPLKIVGDGPLSDRVIEATQRLPKVEWLGRKPLAEVYRLMGEATCLIFPSKWYETFGRVAVEAFAKGTPVIAANIGAIAELVDNGRTGLHFCPGDPDDLSKQVKWLLENPATLAHMRQAARAEFEAKYTVERNYQELINIYTIAHKRQTISPGRPI
ncbi:glycosyltransferase family 4 protein [Thermocoleostomius sinensis]|uniref:Glycosyltransferase family 4 protein n=1 Tax=Thermocoleostomius sinensis A174 TaxID=2016057 RepID=A0A9E8ZGK0_9CYAN|nr:glycosyltransferase family 4 protein [Thermocoleostomius sinensis]WAL62758.1 glycosyltransferase family 4 protein [Thermocoleostomius sinensis A174]